MDYDLENENKGLSKGPFYGAAAFIFLVLAVFASFCLQEKGILTHWEIATCLLGSGLIAILLFLPHFLESIIDKIENASQNSDTELVNQAFFELKEVRSELDALAVKIDKVPTLVDKILSDSPINDSKELSTAIFERIESLESQIRRKLEQIEEAAFSTPLLTENPTEHDDLKVILQQLVNKVDLIEKQISITAQKPKSKDVANTPEIEPKKQEVIPEKTIDLPIEQEMQFQAEAPAEAEKIVDEKPEELESVLNEEATAVIQDEAQEELLDHESMDNDLLSDSSQDEPSTSENDSPPETNFEDQADSIIQEQEDTADELNLELPSPEETLRKVDALLSGEDSKNDKSSEKIEENIDKNGTTTVIANVMIGIGNKPYLRGEGPGLSWDEGVSMNFVEIGKWAWSPPRKNASIQVQVYRNDEDPDKGGKVDVRPGQKLEITPDFS